MLTYMLADGSDFRPAARARFEYARDRAASLGEPWINHYSEAAMIATLRSAGFAAHTSFALSDIKARYFSQRTDGLKAEGGPSLIIGAHTSPSGSAWFDVAA